MVQIISTAARSTGNARKKKLVRKSYKKVWVKARKLESLETLSENCECLCRCDVDWKVVPHVGAGNWERLVASCREMNGRYF